MAYAVQIDVYYYSLEVEFFVWMEPNSDGLFVGLLLVFGLILASGNPSKLKLCTSDFCVW